MELFYKNRYISLFLSIFIILFVVISCYTNVYADNQSGGGHFGSNTDLSLCNKIYDGFDFSDTISQHKSFYFLDNAGNKHGVARVGTAWICLFGTRATFNGSQDEQLNYYLSYYAYSGYKSIGNAFGNLLSSKLGAATKGGYTMLEDVLSSNISSTSSGISYNENDDSISFDSSTIDLLKEQIKEYYYDYIGIVSVNPTDTSHNPGYLVELNHSYYEYEEDYISDFNSLNQYDYSVGTSYGAYNTRLIAGFDKSRYSYAYAGSYGQYSSIYFVDKDMNVVNDSVFTVFLAKSYDTENDLVYTFPTVSPGSYSNGPKILYFHLYNKDSSDNYKESSFYNGFTSQAARFYSKKGMPFTYFKSYSALYNYLHGDQDAYLSSRIDEAGHDISMSISDMNENLGSKMDELIDSINSGNGNMSADELQNAIDKGLEDLNKNTEDIKDNTSDILDILKEQNAILLDILGVTSNIYKVVKETDSKDKTYNINYVQSVFNSMFKGLKNAIFYGENTVRDDIDEDTDDISSIVSDVPPEKKNYHNGLFGRFPFSVPYQLFDWLQVLYVEPVAPKFSFSYAYLFEGFNVDTSNFEVVIDLGDEKYAKWIELVRSGEKLSFIIYMAIATYHRFKNEV